MHCTYEPHPSSLTITRRIIQGDTTEVPKEKYIEATVARPVVRCGAGNC